MDEQLQHPGPRLPEEAVRWLCGDSQRTVLVHGAPLIADADTFASEGHDVQSITADSERVPHRSVDVLVVDRLPDDLTSLARMLRPGGQLVLLHTIRDQRIPWARKLDKALGVEIDEEPAGTLVLSTLFGFVDREGFRHWQHVNTESLTALLAQELTDDPKRDSKTSEALALYADYGRGADGMQLPWVTTCYRATVVESAWETPHALDVHAEGDSSSDGDDLPGEPTVPIALAGGDEAVRGPSSTTLDGDDLLLIDFR
ncbi:hypothetical protein [Nocardioides alcanivorans]|uniref:hypothetical protein n=1 Tax=Nocardioides alcanivorans TaxID=2897352 RepID=UPI001F360831|nr:hypothetical protein [Nocardioides alcanivorans]